MYVSVCVQCAYNKGPVDALCLLPSPRPLPPVSPMLPFSSSSSSRSSFLYTLKWNRLEGGALRL